MFKRKKDKEKPLKFSYTVTITEDTKEVKITHNLACRAGSLPVAYLIKEPDNDNEIKIPNSFYSCDAVKNDPYSVIVKAHRGFLQAGWKVKLVI
jgi:hypothetical protein